MCKINGHSIFTYLAQPWNSRKLFQSKGTEAAIAAQKAQAEEEKLNYSDGDEMSDSASTAKMNNKDRKSRNLSSLRVPLESQNVGASVGSGSTTLGLNLGG